MERVESKRRRFRISLRASMLAVLAIGLGMGYFVNLAREQRAAVAAIKKYGGTVSYDWEFVNGRPIKGTQPHGPKWLRRLLGDEYFQSIDTVNLATAVSVNNVPADEVLARIAGQTRIRVVMLEKKQATDEGLKSIANFEELEALYLWDATEISDQGIMCLKGLKNLVALDISKSKVTDQGLAALRDCVKMKALSLLGTRITDDGLACLEKMQVLQSLIAAKTDISDRGIPSINRLKRLSWLHVIDTKISDEGSKALQVKRPGLKVTR